MWRAIVGQACDLRRQHHRPRRRSREKVVVEGQLANLRRRGFDQFLAAIADVDAPQTRHPVEDAMAIAVVDIAALGMGDDAAAAQAFDFGPVGLRGQMVRDVEAAQFGDVVRSEEHTSELQSLMRISYAVFCLKKKKSETEPIKNNQY